MREEDLKSLSNYRLQQAEEMLRDAEMAYENKSYKTCNNRAYYAIFHAIRAIHALSGYDSTKHSGIISEFQKLYVKTGIFDKKYSVIVKSASEIRNDSDYEDFYITSREQAKEQLDNAREFLTAVKEYLDTDN